MRGTRRWRSSFCCIRVWAAAIINPVWWVGAPFFHSEANYVGFIYLYPWVNEPAFIRESSPSYTQTRGSQRDAQQSEAEFQLQIIIRADFPGFHRERLVLTNLNRLKLQQTRANFRKISLQYSWSLTAAQRSERVAGNKPCKFLFTELN